MAGKFNALQDQLEKAAGRKAAAAPIRDAANEDAPAKVVRKAPVKQSKDVHIGAYLPPGFKTSMMLVRAQTGEDSKTLLAKALNEIFRAHNVPVVDID